MQNIVVCEQLRASRLMKPGILHTSVIAHECKSQHECDGDSSECGEPFIGRLNESAADSLSDGVFADFGDKAEDEKYRPVALSKRYERLGLVDMKNIHAPLGYYRSWASNKAL